MPLLNVNGVKRFSDGGALILQITNVTTYIPADLKNIQIADMTRITVSIAIIQMKENRRDE